MKSLKLHQQLLIIFIMNIRAFDKKESRFYE